MKDEKNYRTWRGWNSISWMMAAALLLAQAVTAFRVWNLKMLPVKYAAPLAVGILLIDSALIYGMFPRAEKAETCWAKWGRMICYMLSLGLTVGGLVGWHAATKLDETFAAITREPAVSAHVGVYILNENSATAIEDISGSTFAMTDSYDMENGQAALAEIQEHLAAEVSVKKYDTVFAMVEDLYTGDVDAMILNVAYTDLFEEIERYRDFSEKTKLIYQYEVKNTAEAPAEEAMQIPTEQTEPVAAQPRDPFIVYLSGSDTRESVLKTSRSDVNILAVVHPEKKQILLVNTPRDYFIPNPACGGGLDKLTHCGLYGVGCSMQALSELYDYPIDYYAQINFTGFETLIDAIGGVHIYSDVDDGVYLKQGDNLMDGEQALKFARDRFKYSDGDHARGRHQMQVIQSVVDQMSNGAIVTNYSDIMDSLQGMFVTSMPSQMIAGLIKEQLATMDKWNVLTYAVAGRGGSEIPSSMPGLYAYVMYPDQEMVDYASELIGRVLDGEKLTQTDIRKR